MHACLSEAGAEHHFFSKLGMYTFHIYEFLQTSGTGGVFCPAFCSCSVTASRLNTAHGSKLPLFIEPAPQRLLKKGV